MAFDTNSTRVHKLINLNLFSGSTDVFRSAVGGYFQIESTEVRQEEQSSISFQEYSVRDPLTPYFDDIIPSSSLKETACDEVVVTNKRFPIRVAGNGEAVLSDAYWKALFVGGWFAGEKINAIYNENIYGYNYFESSLSYPKINAKAISGSIISDEIEISDNYNNYLPDYESYIGRLNSELLIPNFYIISDLQSYGVNATGDDQIIITDNTEGNNEVPYDKDIVKFVTLDGAYENINTVLNYVPTQIGSTITTSPLNTLLSTEYLPKSFVQNPLTASTQDAIKNKLQNIILDNDALTTFYGGGDQITEFAERFPFYTKINFSLDKPIGPSILGATPVFANYITNNEYTTRFLKTLKEAFTGELVALSPTNATYASNLSFISSSEDTIINYAAETTENKDYRYVDFIEMLAYDYNNFRSKTDNCYFVGNKNIYRDAVFDTNGAYRYMNSVSSINTMNDVIDYLNNTANFDINDLGGMLYQSDNPCYNETVAYRVQKVGGSPRGDARTQSTLQNYWFFNSKDVEEFNFIDTQVKYGRDYTYHVYKYVVVVGAKYKFSDLKVTKAIGLDNYDDENNTYGLEFYDPITDKKAEQLQHVDGDDTFENIHTLGTLVQEYSEYPYLADFYLNYEPSVSIYEVPIYSKTLKILDNPPNGINISPYQHLDDSQKIGFGLYYDSFNNAATFPSTINHTDRKIKQDYMNAQDLLSEDSMPFESISRPRYMQIYRLEKKPKSYSDFDNNLRRTLDLRMPGSEDTDETYTVDFFDDKIKTNTKYYYLFRTLNEHRIPGHLSEIYETELISDGGYKYAIFNVLYEQDLEEGVYVNPSKKVRKLIQLQPNMSQLTLNTDLVDFEQEAHTQLQNLKIGSSDDLIWNKKFKVRLTSKKTGKKIDLNITYKLRSS
jgi:hypothetical protein